MQITCTYEFADWDAFTRLAWSEGEAKRINGKWHRTHYYVGLIGFCLVLFVLDLLWQLVLPRLFPDAVWLSRLGFNLLSAAIGGFIFHLCTSTVARATNRKRKLELFSLGYLANQTVTYGLSDAGINFKQNDIQGLCAWSAIKAVRVEGDSLYLFTAPLEAYIFPRRAFPSNSDFEAAAAFSKAHCLKSDA